MIDVDEVLETLRNLSPYSQEAIYLRTYMLENHKGEDDDETVKSILHRAKEYNKNETD